MPPYDPPNSHYCEINAFNLPGDNFKIVGPAGHNFKRLTTKLGIEYLWWNIERNVFEIWGPESKMKSSSKNLNSYMHKFYDKHCKNKNCTINSLDQRQSKRSKIS